MKIFEGRAWKLGNDVDTDLIIPARYMHIRDLKTMAGHCFEPVIPGFATMVQPGDIVVAGANIGCGSSREHAAAVLKELGVSCVIAESFARIFYRNCVNLGLPPLEVSDTSAINNGDLLRIDLDNGVICDQNTGLECRFALFPDFIREIIRDGGLVGHTLKNEFLPGVMTCQGRLTK